jgi:hypothetical protein
MLSASSPRPSWSWACSAVSFGCCMPRQATPPTSTRRSAATPSQSGVRDQRGGGVLPGGDVGGDRQASESFSVRFHHRDHPGVLVTYSYYAAVDEENLSAITVDRETEFMVCTDPADPGGSEVWSAYRHTTLQSGFANLQAATDTANQAAHSHLVCEEPWAGRPPWTPEQPEGPR